jgi:MFS family permease
LAIFAVFAVLYLATRTSYNTFDAVSYANQIAHLYPRTGDPHWLFHPHHLLFNATGYALWRLAKLFGYVGGPLVVFEDYNAIVAALGVALFYVTLRHMMQRSNWLPVIASTGLALSFGYWICATDGRVNATSTTLLLASFAVLCITFERTRYRHAIAAGLLAGLAVLYHESAGLFLIVGVTGIALMSTRAPRLRLAVAFAASWFAVVAIGYLIVGGVVLRLHSPTAFHSWSTEYAELGWWWNFNIAHNLRLDAYALRHAAFVEPPGKRGTIHLAADTPTGLLALYFTTLFGWFVAVYYFFAALPLLWRTHYRPILMMSVVWIVLYAAFFTIWSPGYFVFWVPTLIPISLVLALTMAHYRSRSVGVAVNWLVGVWIAMYATVNVMSSIGLHLKPESSPFQRIAMEYRQHTVPGDVIIVPGVGDLSELEVNLPYFADRDTYSAHTALTRSRDDVGEAIGRLQEDITTAIASGHHVYVTDDLYRMARYPGVVDDLKAHHRNVGPSDLKPLFAPWNAKIAWNSSHGLVWTLTPRKGSHH